MVVDDGEGFREDAVVERAADDVGAHPVAVSGLASAVDDDVGALADGEGKHVGFVGGNGHVVIGENPEVVVVDRELLDGAGTCVDETKSMGFAGCEVEFGVVCGGTRKTRLRAREAHLAIDEVAVGKRKSGSSLSDRVHQALHIGHVVVAIPLLQHDRACDAIQLSDCWIATEENTLDLPRSASKDKPNGP